MQTDANPFIDVPFNFRHTCWFCGEPSSKNLEFPSSTKSRKTMDHPSLTIPSCRECYTIKAPSNLSSIWELKAYVKQTLISKYTKHLAIGENWTEQEIIESDFSGAILGGFGKSAWNMYQISKQRIAYEGWPLCVDGIPIDSVDETSSFEFKGTRYSSLMTCISYFVNATGVDEELLTELTTIVTPSRFDYALKIAKLNKRISHSKRALIIEEIALQEKEKLEVSLESNSLNAKTSSIIDVPIAGTIAPCFAIEWAIEQGVKNLSDLCNLEDSYFDDFERLGGAAAFTSYNGLQLYLEAREDAEWVEKNDPNKLYWLK